MRRHGDDAWIETHTPTWAASTVRDQTSRASLVMSAAGVAFRLAAITGARRSELCALVWSDLDGDRLTIDSSIEIERNGNRSDRQVPTLRDAATKTGNQRVVRLDGVAATLGNALEDTP